MFAEGNEDLPFLFGVSGEELTVVQQIESESQVVLRRIEDVVLESSHCSYRTIIGHQEEIIVKSIPFDELLEGCDRRLGGDERTGSSSGEELRRAIGSGGEVVLVISDHLDVVSEDVIERSVSELVAIDESFRMRGIRATLLGRFRDDFLSVDVVYLQDKSDD